MKGFGKIMITVNIVIDCLLCPVHEAFHKTWESVIGIIIELESMMSPGQKNPKYKVLPGEGINNLLSQGTIL